MSEDTVYKYSIPLEEEGGASKPAYDSGLQPDPLYREYTTTHLVVVFEESKPHFHKDSVNVVVEEVPAEDYVDNAGDEE